MKTSRLFRGVHAMNIHIQKMWIYATILCVVFCVHSLLSQPRSQSFLTLRPPFQAGSPERESLTRLELGGCQSVVQVVPLFGASTNSEDIARYFMINGKSSLLVAGDGAVNVSLRDLSPDHFNIQTVEDTFRSRIQVEAKHEFSGAGLAWRKRLSDNWWMEVSTPYVRVENFMGFDEIILNKGGGSIAGTGLDNAPFVDSMTEAFRQSNWEFGKIDDRFSLVEDGFADVEVRFGYKTLAADNIKIEGYVGFVFPTGNNPGARYVFEPIVGNNGHYGFLYGSFTGIKLWEHSAHSIDLGIHLNTRYLFSNHQIRSFDLKNKEFSRYIASYRTQQEANKAKDDLDVFGGTSGINIYTQEVQVEPGFAISVMSSFLYRYKCLNIEAGYNFYARQAEHLTIDWQEVPAVKDDGGLGNTNRARTMTDNFTGSSVPPEDYTPLQGKDLDLNSASTTSQLSYTFYGVFGWQVREGCTPTILGIGASYEVSINRGINQWMTWLKAEFFY